MERVVNFSAALDALIFTGAVAAYIWLLRAQSSWFLLVLAAFVLASFIWHSETLYSLGLAGRVFVDAMVASRWWFAGGIAALLVTAWIRTIPQPLFFRWFVYLAWCVLQQLLFQNMVYRRLRTALGASWITSFGSGALFAAVHIPNPILLPATLVWGTVSTRMFESRPSIFYVALWQALLSTLLYWLTPVSLHHRFRVGPGYWTW